MSGTSSVAPLRSDRVLVGLLLLGAVVHVGYALLLHRPLTHGDEADYVAQGKHFGTWWASTYTGRTPGYHAFVAVSSRLGLGLDGTRVIQALAVSAACAAAAIVSALRYGRGAGRAVAAIALLYPPISSTVAPILGDGLAAALACLAVLCASATARDEEPGSRWMWMAAVFAAAAALVRGNLAVIVLLVLVVAVRSQRGVGSRMRAACVVAIPVLVLFGPWVGRNYAQTMKLSPLGDNPVPLQIGVGLPVDHSSGRYGAAVRDFHYFLDARADPTGSADILHPRVTGKGRYAQLAHTNGWSVLGQNLRHESWEQLKTSLFWWREMWLFPWDDHLAIMEPPPVPWPLLFALHLAFLALGAAGLWIGRGDPAIRLVFAALVLVTLPFAVYQSQPRMAMPGILVLLVPAGLAADRAVARARAHVSRRNTRT